MPCWYGLIQISLQLQLNVMEMEYTKGRKGVFGSFQIRQAKVRMKLVLCLDVQRTINKRYQYASFIPLQPAVEVLH